MSNPVESVVITRWQDGEFTELADEVVRETSVAVKLNGRDIVTLMTLGEHPEELAVGFLRSEGFVSRREDVTGYSESGGVVTVAANVDEGVILKLLEKRTVTTGCGAGSTFHSPLDAIRLRPAKSAAVFAPEDILARMKELEKSSELFHSTGGAHYAALATPDELLHVRADVGRHNAVDMLSGRAFLDGRDLADCVLLSTGRISSEILRKASAMGVGVVASRSAPTSLSIAMGKKLELTVIGYARAKRMNIYSRPDRIKANS